MTARPPFAERGGPVRGLLDLTTGCYPGFLFGGPLRSSLPVFHFHDVTREWLEPRLHFLVENGYRTVTSDAVARFVMDGVHPGPRAVALTFDDAWTSVWTVATPLLRASGLQATLFVIPARVSDAATIRPGVDEPGFGPTASGPPFATWPEIRAMHESGVIDVQSHTRSHAMIFTDDHVTGFVTPDFIREPLLERPATLLDDDVRFLSPDALGTPLYLRRSRMSDATRFVPDPASAERCLALVANGGGTSFFARPGWQAELAAAAGGGHFEDDRTREAAIERELADARAILNARLGTAHVEHVALPWGIAGDIARRAAARTGHRTAYAERPLRRRVVRAGDDPHGLMRLNGKFLRCLPGRGRQWFFSAV